MGLEEYISNVKAMIDDLKAMCAGLGLANTGDEYKIISELFTYKFLNDKLLFEFNKRKDKDECWEDFIIFADTSVAKIPNDCLIDELFLKQNEQNFNILFDNALLIISELNEDIYSVETSTGKKKPLFEKLANYIRDEDKEIELAKRSINILKKHQFGDVYSNGWDYFSTIFEYLIKDYNKDSGKYAEYFTPVFAGKIMASILYDDQPRDRVTIYDPAAGSGTLLLSMANELGAKNCTIYSQDISQKSTQFLRINLILNKLAHSLHNVIEGNTLVDPYHKTKNDIKKFDFIVSNPPFNMDFSSDIETLKEDKYNRFFADLPTIPKLKKEKMAIYLCFLQHIIKSLNKNGKASVVVPTGFTSAVKGTPLKIRKLLIEKNWIEGVVNMPSNIFANTGTNVSLIFINKNKHNEHVFLMDASSFGSKVKIDGNQRTILDYKEIEKIIYNYKNNIIEDDISTTINLNEMTDKNYSFAPNDYFEIKLKFIELTEQEFTSEVKKYKKDLKSLFNESKSLEKQIINHLDRLTLK